MKSRTFGRRKKPVVPRRDINLDGALPPADTFRTSLLMPKLSARFSMLRDLDDFTSDEPLPEVPATVPLSNSSMSQTGVEGPYIGKMMERAKPRKGNRLFGGRQRVYRTALQDREDHLDGGRSFGKAFYDDDVHSSAFFSRTRHQNARRFGRASDIRPSTPQDLQEHAQQDTPSSRSIQSVSAASTTSGRTRSASEEKSPRACDFVRQSPDKFRRKRLYGSGLGKNILKQQSSAGGRLDHVHPRCLQAPSSIASLRSVSDLSQGIDDMGLEGASVASLPEPDTTEATTCTATESAKATTKSSPLSDAAAALAIDPRDFGKATASGAFQRPQASYNEHQFGVRQRQLQEGRNTPPPQMSPPRHKHREVFVSLGRDRPDARTDSSLSPYRSLKTSRIAQLEQDFVTFPLSTFASSSTRQAEL